MMRNILALPLLLVGCFSPTGWLGSDPPSGTESTGEEPQTNASTSDQPITSGGPTTGASPTSHSTSGATSDPPPTTGGEQAVCGNGFKEAGEACDDGNQDIQDGCSPGCQRDALFVFVTSTPEFPVFMSAKSADEICTLTAAMSGLLPLSQYVAWVSDASSEVFERMTPTGLPYIRTDLAPVVNGTADFMNAMLYNPIDHTEEGVSVGVSMGMDCRDDSFMVWTGTTSQGASTDYTCENWTTSMTEISGHAGLTYMTTGAWAVACITPCSQALRLYCFEQP